MQNCSTVDKDGTCASTNSADITVVAAATAVVPLVTQRNLVMMLNYTACGLGASYNESTVRNIFLGAAQDGSGGIASKFAMCSYGKFVLNVSAFAALTVTPDCSLALSCGWWNIATGADAAAKALIGTAAFSYFTHLHPAAWNGE